MAAFPKFSQKNVFEQGWPQFQLATFIFMNTYWKTLCFTILVTLISRKVRILKVLCVETYTLSVSNVLLS